ncbi:hypothetical protein HBI04_190300 [Parastagonospora nodorum]|nr:hypothetical protein HBI03_131880 [Parastagonospora nodorum]KAH4264000.1 hypothetical protein HBI04_190300 [Parastagonospora nodorum]
MAEIIGVIGSTIAIANSAAQLSRALFDIVQTFKNAREEIADIAHQLQILGGTLHSLWNIMHSQHNLCQPVLFDNTNAILHQYCKVDKELRKLIDGPKSLARLTWYIKKTKVKSLLKRVEAIKISLALELTVVQFAREEVIRQPAEPNRYRPLLESAVQANRQIVESAQRDSIENTLASDQRRAEVDVYREGTFDTATWLYHLVFTSQAAEVPKKVPRKDVHRLQPSVVDESTENLVRFTRSPLQYSPRSPPPPPSPSTGDADKTMIVWTAQTEPNQVIDRLLSTWTTLTHEQIGLSSRQHVDNKWRKDFLNTIEQAKHEGESDFNKWEEDNPYSSEESDSIESAIDEIPGPHRHRTRVPDVVIRNNRVSNTSYDESTATSKSDDEEEEDPVPTYVSTNSKKGNKKGGESRNLKQSKSHKKTNTNHTRSDRAHTAAGRTNPFVNNVSSPPRRPRTSRYYSEADNYAVPNGVPGPAPVYPLYPSHHPQFPVPRSDSLNPFTLGGFQNPYESQASRNPFVSGNFPSTTFPSDPPWPPQAPLHEDTMAHPSSTASLKNAKEQKDSQDTTTTSKEDAMLATISRLIADSGKSKTSNIEDPRLANILQMLILQQEKHAEVELERAKATAEVEMRQILAARDRDDSRIRQLEALIIQQKEEQEKSDARWRAERAALDEESTRQAQETKELAEREIAAARSAKKAARKALKFAQAEAEKRAKEEADAKAKAERKKTNKQSKERIQKYEKLLDAAVEGRAAAFQSMEQPLRRTCITDGKRSVEVAEYSSKPHANSSILTPGFIQDAVYGARTDNRLDHGRQRMGQRWLSQSYSSVTSQPNSRLVPLEMKDTTETQHDINQQMILFPARLNKSSAKTTELQSSLAKIGVNTSFVENEFNHFEASSYMEDTSNEGVRSSVFWEGPSSSLGSELLSTYRRFGWKPPYARTSSLGQTHFLGSQPIHSYFFQPDYKPQFSSCEPSVHTETIIIDKALIHEYALTEMGHKFCSTESGSYELDGRLQYSDIEALIERSFQMRENYLRKAYRQLGWQPKPAQETKKPAPIKTSLIPRVPQSPVTATESQKSYATSEDEEDESGYQEESDRDDLESTASNNDDTGSQVTAGATSTEFEEQNEDDDSTADTGLDVGHDSSETSNVSTSLTTWSSNSKNPFRNASAKSTKSGRGRATSENFVQTAWDEPLILLD